MPSTRDIRRRIKSVKNTAQITKAMQMVASSKMRKAQLAALAGRPYATLMNNVLAAVSDGAGDFTHPLMETREGGKRAVIIVSTDKGLCGALNSNLLREAARFDKESTVYVAAGRKGAQFVSRTRRQLAAEFNYKDNPQFAEARAISRFAQDLFIKLFEPNPAAVLGNLLPHYVNFQVFQFLLEAKASEHSARMVAMKNATDNAKQIIKDLTLEYNKLRQANITKELLEITTAQMAMG